MNRTLTTSSVLRTVGALMAAFTVVGGLVVLFVIPCNRYASAFCLLSLGFLFLIGVIVFLVGFISSRRGSESA